MELNLRSDIGQWLDKLEKIDPIPTEFCPNLRTETPAKAVIFDIYGTLLISSSGDIEEAYMSKEDMFKALEAGGFDPGKQDQNLSAYLVEHLPLTIQKHHKELKKKGHPFPDVDIFKVWNEIIDMAVNEKMLSLIGQESLADTIAVFEILSNKVWPMPGMLEVLTDLRAKGIPLGIVSNAQFYTPILMNYFLTGNFSANQEIGFFDPDLTVYSFRELRAKPDVKLFEKIRINLARKYKIQPSEAVFIGNDILKDVYTAKKSGLQTALFSGDQRSLRIREGDPRVKGIFPDFFINDLKQVLEIVK